MYCGVISTITKYYITVFYNIISFKDPFIQYSLYILLALAILCIIYAFTGNSLMCIRTYTVHIRTYHMNVQDYHCGTVPGKIPISVVPECGECCNVFTLINVCCTLG